MKRYYKSLSKVRKFIENVNREARLNYSFVTLLFQCTTKKSEKPCFKFMFLRKKCIHYIS